MPLTRPTQDAGALLYCRAVSDHEQQSLLALVLKKLSKREPALLSDRVDLSLRMHARGDAGRQQQKRCGNNSVLEWKVTLFRDMTPSEPYESRTTKWI